MISSKLAGHESACMNNGQLHGQFSLPIYSPIIKLHQVPGLPVRGWLVTSLGAGLQPYTQRPLGCCLAVGFSPPPPLPFSLTTMLPQTFMSSLRRASCVAKLMRRYMRSIALRVPSAANARLSSQHASTRFLTAGTMGFLGVVRVYIPIRFIPLASDLFGPSLLSRRASCQREYHY